MNARKEGTQAGVIYLLLLALLVASVGSLFFHLGLWQPLILLVVAGVQAILIVLFFMQVRSSTPLIWLLSAGGFLWLAILLLLVLSDYVSRSWVW
jgi:cytochrome c oxidase subunit IV